MKVAVVGSGGREHAILHCLAKSKKCTELLAIPGNGGMAALAQCVPIDAKKIDEVVQYCDGNEVDYVVVAPDDPLALGMVDALAQVGIPAFGPTKAAARIEASKVFAKDLMRRYEIPTAGYESFTDPKLAEAYIQALKDFPVVVKADGLALGKGVLICESRQQALEAVQSIMCEKVFGESGSAVVIEEFLTGPEVSVLAFCDGKTLVPMVSSMDHKRALDGDKGLNTGGMGAVAPNPYYTEAVATQCMEQIYLPTVRAMRAEGAPFKGCLYFGLMLTKNGPKVIEYNCRFGDPEAQVVLPLLESDLMDIMLACTKGTLKQEDVKFAAGAAACVVMASGGYPVKYETGLPIEGMEDAEKDERVCVFHAGTVLVREPFGDLKDGAVVSAGGRVLGVTATADTMKDAIESAYKACEKIRFKGAHTRTDIGKKALEALEKG